MQNSRNVATRALVLAGIVATSGAISWGCGSSHTSGSASYTVASHGGISPASITIAATGSATQPVFASAQVFSVLAGSTVTSTGATTLSGYLGVSPGSAVTGFPPGIVGPPGTIHAADEVAAQAETDLATAYNSLAAEPTGANLSGQDLGGLTLVPGVYTFSSSAELTGTLTLNNQGNLNALFVFQIGSTLTTATNSSIVMVNPATCGCNVYWQVGSSATLGTGTVFEGTIVALTSITMNSGATLMGKALARNGAVTLQNNVIEGCTGQ